MKKFAHCAAYAALSTAYGGLCLGLFEKEAVSAAAALLYLLLALASLDHAP